MPDSRVPPTITQAFWPYDHRHAVAILTSDFQTEWRDLVTVLAGFRVKESEMTRGGGNKGPIARSLERAFGNLGWRKANLETRGGRTHEIDSYKNKIALEVEWNSKDSVFDRDLDAFRTLHEERLVDVAVIITRSSSLKSVYADARLQDGEGPIARKYGESTTHFAKLREKIERGGGGGCPILVFSITPLAISYDITNRVASSIPVDDRDNSV